MSNGYKPCPFCGSDVWAVEHIDTSIIKRFWRVECLDSDCEAEGISCTSYDSAEDAARIWNTRPVEDALRTENEELRAQWESVPWEAISFILEAIYYNDDRYEGLAGDAHYTEVHRWIRNNMPVGTMARGRTEKEPTE